VLSLLGRQLGTSKEGNVLIKNRPVTGGRDVVCRREGEPEQIIRAARTHTSAGGGVPPVQNVSILELVGGALQEVRSHTCRGHVREAQHILQLVPKTDRPARLVEAATRKQARSKRLIEEPAVQHQVKRGIGRVHLDTIEKLVPEGCRAPER